MSAQLKRAIEKGMINKRSVIKNFSVAAATYDDFSDIQREAALMVARLAVGLLGKARPALVLDAGCGTGALMEGIKTGAPQATLVGSDIALPMASRARRICDRVAAADCEALPFRDAAFDMVASSLAYQWTDIGASAREAARVLKPGGALVFATLGPGSLVELDSCRERAELEIFGRSRALPARFRGVEAVSGAVRGAGLAIASAEVRPMKRLYRDAFDLVRTLKMVGASEAGLSALGGFRDAAVLRRTAAIYASSHAAENGGVAATYEVIFVTARKG